VSPTGPEAGEVYVSNETSGTVSVINPATITVTATITVGSEPAGVAVSPTGPEAGEVYVSNETSGTVSVIDPATNTVTVTTTVGSEPAGVAVSPTGPEAGEVYVSNETSGTVSILDWEEVSVPTIALPGSESVPNVGDALTAVAGTWLPSNVSYQWDAGGEVIAGATSSTFTATAAQVGEVITVSVSNGAGSETSAPTADVATTPTTTTPTTTTPTTTTPTTTTPTTTPTTAATTTTTPTSTTPTVKRYVTVRIRGLRRGATYFGAAPAPRCVMDTNASQVSCRITRRLTPTADGTTASYTAGARGSAGVRATARVTVHIVDLELGRRSATHGIYRVRPDGHYTLRVASSTRPLYTGVAAAPRIPTAVHTRLHRSGSVRGVPVWTLQLHLRKSLSRSSTWNLGVRIGGRTQILRIRT
ncbi:MAG: hypothetical protein ACRDNS_32075, partial [Trebonia sp.]